MKYTIKINKTGKNVEIDSGELPENVTTFLMEYGLKQLLNDSHSQVVWKRKAPSADGIQFSYMPDDMQDESAFDKDVFKKARRAYKDDVTQAVADKVTQLQNGILSARKSGPSMSDKEKWIAKEILKEGAQLMKCTMKALTEKIAETCATHSEGVNKLSASIAKALGVSVDEYLAEKSKAYEETREKVDSVKLDLANMFKS